jgi:hypothetical protein
MQPIVETLKYFPPPQNMFKAKRLRSSGGAMYLNPKHLRQIYSGPIACNHVDIQ